jgi:hypothetical protein
LISQEEKIASANILLELVNQVKLYNHHYANYLNTLVYIKNKYGDNSEELQKLEEEDKNILIQNAQYLRYHAAHSYNYYKSVITGAGGKITSDPDIEALMKEIKETFIIKLNVAEELAVKFLFFISKDIVKNLLETSSDLINKLYQENAK